MSNETKEYDRCIFVGCWKPVTARHLCFTHYQRVRRTGELRLLKSDVSPKPSTKKLRLRKP